MLRLMCRCVQYPSASSMRTGRSGSSDRRLPKFRTWSDVFMRSVRQSIRSAWRPATDASFDRPTKRSATMWSAWRHVRLARRFRRCATRPTSTSPRHRPDAPVGLVQPRSREEHESHYTRALLTSRKVMQRKCIDLENEIRGVLKIFGVKLPMRLSRGAFEPQPVQDHRRRFWPAHACCRCWKPGRCSSTPSSNSIGG